MILAALLALRMLTVASAAHSCCSAGHVAAAADPQINSIAPYGVQRGTEAEVDDQRQPAGRREGDSVLLRRASRSRAWKPTSDDTLKARSPSPPIASWAFTPCRLRSPTRRQQPAHVHRRQPAGSRRKSSRTTSFDQAAADPAERHRQRRRAGRRRRSLRRRAEEGRAADRRAGRAAAGQHVLRSLPGDSRRRRGSNWPAATTRRCSARTACARSSPRRTASTSFRSARVSVRRQRQLQSIACTSAPSRGRRPSFRRAASRAKRSRSAGSAIRPANSSSKSRCRPMARPKPAVVAQDVARPGPFAQRAPRQRSARTNRSRAERRT